MSIRRKVEPGDCISSIAFEYGFHPDTVWLHEENAKLREKREDPNVLLPEEDVVFVPERRVKEVQRATGQRHRFRRKGVPELLRLRLLDKRDKPRVGLSYVLLIDGEVERRGVTDGEGKLVQPIPPNARMALLTLVGTGDPPEEYELLLGHLHPVDTAMGVCSRLRNLGFLREGDNNTEEARDEELWLALIAFQKAHGLEQTGEIDDATREMLESGHLS